MLNVIGSSGRSGVRPLAVAAAVGLASFFATNAHALVVSGDANAFGVSTGLTLSTPLLPPVGITLGPVPAVAGVAPAPFNNNAAVVSASVTGGGSLLNIITVNTGAGAGVLTVNASSNVDGLPGVRTANADATVENTAISINSTLPLFNSIFSLDATVIQSTAEVNGDFGALTSSGTTTLAGLGGVSGTQATITVLGVTTALDVNAAPNSLISFDLNLLSLGALQGSISLVLNEQISTGDGISSLALDVNAIHLMFSDVGILGTELLNGDIVLSHSHAALNAAQGPGGGFAVPEPASISMLVMGLFGLAARRGRSVV